MSMAPEKGASAPFFFGRLRLGFLAFASCFVVAGWANAWQHTDRQPLIELMRQEMSKRHTPGAALLVFRDRRLVLAHLEGLANCATGQVLTWDTPMLLASLSKPFWGSRLLRLHRSRHVALSDRVVAGFSHSAGPFRSGVLARYPQAVRHDFSYSNDGFSGAFLEVSEVIASEPMSSSEREGWRQAWSSTPPAGLVTGHLSHHGCRGVVAAVQAWAGLQAGSGRLALSGRDAASWLQRLLAEDRVGRFLSRAWTLSVPVPFRDGPTQYGMGWFLQKSPNGLLLEHTGFVPGHGAHLRVWEQRGDAVMLLANQGPGAPLPETMAQASRLLGKSSRVEGISSASDGAVNPLGDWVADDGTWLRVERRAGAVHVCESASGAQACIARSVLMPATQHKWLLAHPSFADPVPVYLGVTSSGRESLYFLSRRFVRR